MGCVIQKKDITIVSSTQPRLVISNSTTASHRPRNSLVVNSSSCLIDIKQNDGNPYDYYDVKSLLGRGSFGTVYKVKHKISGTEYAMKVLVKDDQISVSESELLKEINILKTLDHQNIIKIYEYFNNKKEIFIISELCQYGELFNKLYLEGHLKEEFVWKVMKQVLSAVSHCHSSNIIHRDIKPQNVLIYDETEEDIDIKIIDFGNSEIFSKSLAPSCIGTVYYIAPEVVRYERYDSKCDLWSCGIMMYFLLSGEFPFTGETEEEVFVNVLKGRFTFSSPIWDTISDQAKHLISGLLTTNPVRRLSAKQALEHKWIKNNVRTVSSQTITETSLHFSNVKVNELLQHAALRYLVRGCKKTSEFREVRRKSGQMNVNNDDKLSIDELVESFCKIMRRDDAIKYVNESFKTIDLNKNGFIDFEEFLKVSLEKNILFSENNLQNTFKLFDHNKDGKICENDLKAVINNYNALLWKDLISQYDKDSDDMLIFNEFKEMMNQIKVV
jgi:calcium-dependent protein kinase